VHQGDQSEEQESQDNGSSGGKDGATLDPPSQSAEQDAHESHQGLKFGESVYLFAPLI